MASIFRAVGVEMTNEIAPLSFVGQKSELACDVGRGRGCGWAAYIYILRFCRTRRNGPAQTKFPLQIRYIVKGNGERMKLPEAYFPFRSPHFQNGFSYPLMMFRKYRGFAYKLKGQLVVKSVKS